MANPFTSPEEQMLKQRQRMADLLRSSALQGDEQTQAVGGWAIPNNQATPFKRLGMALIANRAQRGVDEDVNAFTRNRAKQLAEALKSGDPEAVMQIQGFEELGGQMMRDNSKQRFEAEQSAIRRRADEDEARKDREIELLKIQGKAPPSRTYRQGGEEVTEQYNPQTGKYEEIGRGPAWNPNPPSAVSISYGAPVAAVDESGKPVLVQPSRDGSPPAVLPGLRPPSAQKPATREERMDAGYATRMQEAEATLGGLNDSARPTFATETIGNIPMIGNYAETAAMTPDQQKYRQAQEDWVRAKLRKESGAAIGKDEMEREIRTYFPPPGVTDPEVIAQYAAARQRAIKAMEVAAGAGMRPMSDGFSISPDQSKPSAVNWSDL